MPDVFLSYSSRDRDAAEQIQRVLAARGVDVFWDQETPPGQDWDAWIRGKLSACKVAIVLWSRASIESPNVRHEAIVARDAHKLVPAMIDKLKPGDFPMGLYLVQAVDLQDWRNADGKGMMRLLAEVETRIGKRTPGAVPPAPPPRKINWIGVGLGIVGVAAATGLTQWIYSPKTTPASPGLTSLPCSNGLPRLSTGDCPAVADPSASIACPNGGVPILGQCPVAVLPDGFAMRVVGRWHWEDQTCENGTDITLSDGKLEFATWNEPVFVHRIESDTPDSTITTVVAPETDAGQAYTLSPEYVATSDPRNFNLVVETGTDKHIWYPCPPR